MDLARAMMIGGRYRLERLLGEGGMGTVWVAEDTAAGGLCALKLMKDAAGDPEARKRFLREGLAVSTVRHPNVVRILEVLEPEGEPPAIVMELLEGESLRELLRRQRQLSVVELAEIMLPVVSAVGTAHALGIVHRDLKPENIFVVIGAGGERVVKVLDFGIAKLTALDSEAVRATGITTGAVLGTPAYMAPEQIFAERDLDHRADVWALGVIFYECLAGVCPTDGDNVGQVLKHVVSKPFVAVSDLVPELPESVSRLVTRMLARDRSQRPADMHEVLAVLEPFADCPGGPFGAPVSPSTSDPALAATVPLAARHGGAAKKHPGAKPPHEGTPRTPRTRNRAALAGAIAVVVVVGMAAPRLWPTSSPAAAVGSVLDPPDAKIACPVLRASGVDPPAGWLGAAAAAVACERARIILGGRPERTLVPAELLGLPRGPVDAFPADPYGQPGAGERSVATARARAQAYLDGDVTRTAAGFEVMLVLRRASGAELERATGRGRGLYEAVRSAMEPLVGASLIPKASELDPGIAAWSRTGNIDAALAVLDVRFALAHNAGGLPDECRRFELQSDSVRELAPLVRFLCAYTVGEAAPRVEPAAIDKARESPEAAATKMRIRYAIHGIRDADDGDYLHRLFDREKTSWGKSLLAATESCIVQSDDPERAYELALTAVRMEPENSDGQMCNPWEQLITMTRGSGIANDSIRAMQAWVPWGNIGWRWEGLHTRAPEAALVPLRRAYELAPFNTHAASLLADNLLAVRRREDARRIAFDLRAGNHPVHVVASKLILLRVDASEAQLGKALEQAQAAFPVMDQDEGWVRALRFEVAWRALEVAAILGRTSALADDLVGRFLDPDPPVLDVFSDIQVPEPDRGDLHACLASRGHAMRRAVARAARPAAGREHGGHRRPPGGGRALRQERLRRRREGLASAAPRIGQPRFGDVGRHGDGVRAHGRDRSRRARGRGRDAPRWRVQRRDPGACARSSTRPGTRRRRQGAHTGTAGHRCLVDGRRDNTCCRRDAPAASASARSATLT